MNPKRASKEVKSSRRSLRSSAGSFSDVSREKSSSQKIIEDEQRDLAVYAVREQLLQKTLDACYEKYLEKQSLKLTVHCAYRAWRQAVSLSNFVHDYGKPFYEGHPAWHPGETPTSSPADTWAARRVPIRPKMAAEAPPAPSPGGDRDDSVQQLENVFGDRDEMALRVLYDNQRVSKEEEDETESEIGLVVPVTSVVSLEGEDMNIEGYDMWDVKDITQKDHRSLRINIEFDHPTYVKWSPDTKAFIINKYSENTVEVYKVEKKKDGWLGAANKVLTFPKVHEQDVIGFGIACNGKFIMTCSNKTDLVIWDLKGQQLATVDTYLMSTACAKISPCGRFIVASGFAPDVKVWEVIFAKSGGEFQEVKRAFELVGHTSGVHDVAFDADSSHIATVSKDGTWKLFDVNVEYKKGEDPHLKTTGSYAPRGGATRISLSPNAEVVAISTSNSVALYSTQSGQLNFTIENIFNGDVVFLSFDALGKYLFTAGDKHIRVFHNVTGYHCAIASAKEKLKQSQTSATKERLEKLIVDSQKFLEAIENKQ